MQTETGAALAADMDVVAASGAKWLRFDADWWNAQGSSGASFYWGTLDNVVAAANARNLNVLFVIGSSPPWASATGVNWGTPTTMANLTSFVTALVNRYAPLGVHTYEVWNEPNQTVFWGGAAVSASAYVTLLQAVYSAIKTADSTAFVISAGLAPEGDSLPSTLSPLTFLQNMYTAGAHGYMDAVGMHPYCYNYGPDAVGTWNQWYSLPSIYATMVANGDQNKPIWATECGAPTGAETTVAAGSNGTNVSTFAGAGTLNVVSAAALPASGSVSVMMTTLVGFFAGDRVAAISYTGKTGTSLTGCTLTSGSGVLSTGMVVVGGSQAVSAVVQANTYVTDCFGRWKGGSLNWTGPVNLGNIFWFMHWDYSTDLTNAGGNFGLAFNDYSRKSSFTAMQAVVA